MPELPEVETIRKQLDSVLAGQKIKAIEKLHPKSLASFAKVSAVEARIIGKKIVAVKRRAKMIWIDLGGDLNLLVHLKMTGQLLLNAKPGKHTRVIIHLTKDKLIFNDLRIFGWIKTVTNEQLKKHFAKLPPDVVDKGFTVKYLEKILKNSGRAVKLVLLDQAKMGGIGNIYANEALFGAGIRPTVPARQIKDFTKLHHCVVRVIKAGIRAGGTTASDDSFVNLFGRPGRYQKQLQVYENKDKCFRCGTKITKIKLGGRGTYFCSQCQP